MPDPTKVFVIHGRNLLARDAMFIFLESAGLTPIERSAAVHLAGGGSVDVARILDSALTEAQAVVVLLTGDEEARLRDQFQRVGDPPHETSFAPQPRANVLFEAGLAFGRFPNRTLFVELEPVRPFSDVSGLYRIQFDGTREPRKELFRHLGFIGCAVDESSTRYLDAGDFAAAIRESSRPIERNGELGVWTLANTAGKRQLTVDVYPKGNRKWIWLRCTVRSIEPLSDPLSGAVKFDLHEEFDVHFQHAVVPVARGEAIYVVPTDGPFEVRAEAGNIGLRVNLKTLRGINWWRP
jgi:Predicted nucleotide-binding protein containing TIR-like domain